MQLACYSFTACMYVSHNTHTKHHRRSQAVFFGVITHLSDCDHTCQTVRALTGKGSSTQIML